MNTKKMSIIAVVVVVIAIVVIIASKYYPPSQNADSTGTIGVVKKYNAGQMSQKDVKLKNVMLKDTATIRQSVERLKVYKTFITGLASDMGKWNEEIENAKKTSTKGLKDEKILTEKAASFVEYKTYIEKNISTVDNTINLLSKLSKADTLNLENGIENTITAYENFRIQVAQKFETMLASIPSVHNAFVKNGIKGIIGNTTGAVGVFITNNAGTMGSAMTQNTLVGNNMTFAVVALNCSPNGNVPVVGNKIDLNAVAMGNTLVGVYCAASKPGLESYTIGNVTANNKLTNNKFDNNAVNATSPLGMAFGNTMNFNTLTGNKAELNAAFMSKEGN